MFEEIIEILSKFTTLKKEEMTKLLYRFSREVEHSDENLKKIDRIMEKKWILK